MLVVADVTKEYPTRGDTLVVLRGVSLQLKPGESAAVTGPSGSGKSTLLNVIGTLDSPSSGTVTLDDVSPHGLDEAELAKFRNRRIGFIFQDHHLLPQLSVYENILVPSLASGSPDDATIKRAEMLMTRVGLAERREHRPAELSGGERQRAAVARALLLGPRLLLADEPTGNLDRTNAQAIAHLLLELQKQEQTMLIVVTHSQEMAGMFGDRFEMDDGKLRGA